MHRVLLSRRWIVAHLVVLLVLAGFIELGFWQLRRLRERQSHNALVERRVHMPVVPFGSLNGEPAESIAYRRVSARGTYDVDQEVLLLARSNGDVPGNQVLTPLRVSGEPALIVDRGAVALTLDKPKEVETAPPHGGVVVTGLLLPSERRGLFGPTLPASGHLATIARIDIPRLRAQIPYAVAPVFLLLQRQEPPQAGAIPGPVSLAPLSEGPHLGYAIQWFLFSGIAVVTYAALIRRSVRTAAA